MTAALLFLGLLGQTLAGEPSPSMRSSVPELGSLSCGDVDPCEMVLPGAVRFERLDGKPYATGFDEAGETIGWVVLSNDVIDIKAYSGKPLSTLVGLDPDGVITGGRVVHHGEPILLVGIPEQTLHDFVSEYAGIRAEESVSLGASATADHQIDGVSGATVTVLAQNQTILGAARVLAQDVGVLARTTAVPGHFVDDAEPMTWRQMVRSGALGNLRIEASEMGLDTDLPFLDLWFGFADAPHVGIPLLGVRTWQRYVDKLQPGEHLIVVVNGGTTSFRGSGFVRGGIFDRFRLEQGLSTQTFRDTDYKNIGQPEVPDAPELPEGGLFITRDGHIDPGAPLELVFLATEYDTSKGAFNRDFKSFGKTWQAPNSVYRLDGRSPAVQMVVDAWTLTPVKTILATSWLLFVAGLFFGRRWLTSDTKRLKKIHVSVMAGSFLLLGVALQVQPSITQLLTILGGLIGEWRWTLYLSDPVIFLSWIFIAGILLVWGRGVFCGWACPYGAMNELTFLLGQKIGLPEILIPDKYHHPLRYMRYVVLFSLIGVFLYDAQLGEQMAEVEPFKSTFYVAPWTRHPGLFAWWSALLAWSMFTWRPFCQYLCPLGASLAIPSYLRVSGPRRREFCSKCKICTRTCEPRAIDKNGVINGADCLNCMECEANYYDDEVCPPLVKERRDRERGIVSGVVTRSAS